MYYNKCPYCNAHLDPGEHCDCENERKRNRKKRTKYYKNLSEYMEEIENERIEV